MCFSSVFLCWSLYYRGKTDSGTISLHAVPEFHAKKWALVLKMGKCFPKYAEVCSAHFKENDFVCKFGAHPTLESWQNIHIFNFSILFLNATGCKGKKRLLKFDAVPSQNLPVRSTDKIVSSPERSRREARKARCEHRRTRHPLSIISRNENESHTVNDD